MNEIKNDFLKVVINPVGAELWSISDKEGNEYLWQGDENIWRSKAPNLFPYIARLTEGCYTLEGKTYEMERHGFIRGSYLTATQSGDDCVTFTLEQNEETLKQYPYDFKYKVVYKLVENSLNISYVVENNSDKTMYFGIGGHPGFNVPFAKGTDFEDYYLEFSEACFPKIIGFTETSYVSGVEEDYKLLDDKKINLQHSLFETDLVLLKDMSKSVTIKSDKTEKSIRVDYPDFDYVGFWHMAKTEAPYLCVEPWTSLPSRQGIVEDLAKQENLVTLAAKCVYENSWSVTVK